MTQPHLRTATVCTETSRSHRALRSGAHGGYRAGPALSDADVVDAVERALARGPTEVVLWGRSMIPTLWPGSRARVTPCRLGELRVREIAVVRVADRLIAHRVVAVHPGLRLRGDAHDHDDAITVEPVVLGRVTSVHLGSARWASPAPRLRDRWLLVSAAGAVGWRRLRGPVDRLGRSILGLRFVRAARRRLQHWVSRPAVPEDWDSLRRALLEAGTRVDHFELDAWVDAMANDAAWLAEDGATIVGWGRRNGSDVRIGVRRSHRRLGLESELLGALESRHDTTA